MSFNIIWPNNKIYYLDYWFENPNYYMEWWVWDVEVAEEMSWLSVNWFNWNFLVSELMLDTMKWVLNDEKYIDRLKKHYFLMKEEVKWYEDPFSFEQDFEDDILYLDDDWWLYLNSEWNKNLDKKVLKERKKKKLVKKQKQKLRKKKKK